MKDIVLGVFLTLTVEAHAPRLRAAYHRCFDSFDRWASRRWPTTPKGRDEDGRLVEYVPAPQWAQSTTVEFHALIRHAFPLEAT